MGLQSWPRMTGALSIPLCSLGHFSHMLRLLQDEYPLLHFVPCVAVLIENRKVRISRTSMPLMALYYTVYGREPFLDSPQM